MDAQDVLDRLTRSAPVNLASLPEEFGIYALWDHERQIRYIGSTTTDGFHTRIYNKHTRGSEGSSHKFSQAYCTGRMWRHHKRLHGPAIGFVGDAADAKAARELRARFIRRYCAATYVTVPRDAVPAPYKTGVEQIEFAVQAIAPASMRAWEGIRFAPVSEPAVLVDALLAGMPHLAAAADRQRAIYAAHLLRVRA